MNDATPTAHKLLVNAAAIFAVPFGVLAIASGGIALLGSAQAKTRVGNTVEASTIFPVHKRDVRSKL